MQTKKRTPSMTDRRLRQLLKQLREEPAAPQGFRDQVLVRLEKEGVLPRRAAAQGAGWRQALQGFWRPAGFGLAAAGAWALLLVLNPNRPAPAPLSVAVAGAPAAAKPALAVAAPKRHRALTARRAPLAPVVAQAAPAPEGSLETAPQVAPALAPALGSSLAPRVAQQQVVAASNTTVTATPAPTIGKPAGVDSKVFNNVVHAARGESAVLHYDVRSAGHVHIQIVTRLGQTIATADLDLGPGTDYTWSWFGMTDQNGMAASGIYLLRLQTPDYTAMHKILLVK
jgi:hypothetical protein